MRSVTDTEPECICGTTLADVKAEFPGWRCWLAWTDVYVARERRSHSGHRKRRWARAPDPAALRTEITRLLRDREGG